MKRITVTGSSKLAAEIIKQLNATSVRIEEVLDGTFEFSTCDVFINNAHVDFNQSYVLQTLFDKWKDDSSKLIINISSRAGLPNLSKGYMYAAQKAALDHLSENLTYNSNKQCRITTIGLGMLEDELPSVSYIEVVGLIECIIQLPQALEIPKIYLQHSCNYQTVQQLKAPRYESTKDSTI